MSLLSRLSEKGWEATGAEGADPAEYRPPAERVAMIVYFGVATVLFGLLSSAYVMRMGDMAMVHGAQSDWRPMPEPPLIWINTALLLASSLAWEAARAGLRHLRPVTVFAGTLGAGLLALLFLVGQFALWGEYARAGYYAAANPANAFFYLITALHGLHLIGGLFFWGRALSRQFAGADLSAVRLTVELTAAYWHFLLLVWLIMLGLLIST